jgi:hypothetical protein
VDRGFLAASRVLGALLVGIGAAMVVTTLARGGGPLSLGVLVGAAFTILGAARIRLAGLGPPRR